MPPLAACPPPSFPPPTAGFPRSGILTPNSPTSQTITHTHHATAPNSTTEHCTIISVTAHTHHPAHVSPSLHQSSLYNLQNLLLSSSLPQHPQITKSTSPGLHRNKSATISITNGRCNAIDVGNAAAIVRTWLRPPPGRASAPCPGRSTGPEMACILHLTKPE